MSEPVQKVRGASRSPLDAHGELNLQSLMGSRGTDNMTQGRNVVQGVEGLVGPSRNTLILPFFLDPSLVAEPQRTGAECPRVGARPFATGLPSLPSTCPQSLYLAPHADHPDLGTCRCCCCCRRCCCCCRPSCRCHSSCCRRPCLCCCCCCCCNKCNVAVR